MIAVVMCGGMGTRMRPITDVIPKPMLTVGGREVLDILIEKLTNAGVDTIYLTLGYMGDTIREYVENKQYNANVIPVFEDFPLGTAGGVLNAVGETMEDILVLSGDNIFSFDLKQAYFAHLESEAMVSLIGVRVEDPRNYGTVQIMQDGTITEFIEKPSWAQVESDIINTGIYFLKGECLSLVSKGCAFDFANDLFPLLMQKEYKLNCILADGIWGDLGDINSYFDANKDVLNGIYGDILNDGNLITHNKILDNGTTLIAPCVIGNRVTIGDNCRIGPHAVVGSDCRIGNDCEIAESILADDAELLNGIVACGAYIGNNCIIGRHVRLEKGCVLAGNVSVRSFAVIGENSKISAGCEIKENEIILRNVVSNTFKSSEVTAEGLQGKPMSELTIQQALNLGCAVASCKNILRVGVADDGNIVSVLFKNAIALGLQSCSATVYDFGEIVRCQKSFLSQYCKLDFFICVTLQNEALQISFSAENGAPVSRKTEREIQAACRYLQFNNSNNCDIKESFLMNPLVAVYKAILMHKLPQNFNNERVAVECDNRLVYEMMHDIIRSKGYRCDYGGLLFMIDKNGEKFYVVENERAYSYDRILTICCNYELEKGFDVSINESAPGLIEFLSKEKGRKAIRLYESDFESNKEDIRRLVAFPWIYDGLMCIVKLIEIMNKTKKSLQQLSDELPDYFVKAMTFVYKDEPKKFREKLLNNGAVRSEVRKGYYEWEDERGTIRLKPDSVCRNIKVLIESESIEFSRELAAEAEAKLKNCAIDKL